MARLPRRGKGWPGVHGQGRDQGQQVAVEVVLDEVPLGLIQLLGLEDVDALGVELGLQDLVEELVLAGRPGRGCAWDTRSRSCRGVCPSGPGWVMPASIWRQMPATRTMKNSSQLLETMARNLTRSSRGTVGILRLLQDALVEGQPAQLAVQDLLGSGEGSAHGIHYRRSRCPGCELNVAQLREMVPGLPAGSRDKLIVRPISGQGPPGPDTQREGCGHAAW